jgi:ribonuclease HII
MRATTAVDTSSRYLVGIDENGLGPRLGPLIVTSVLARATEAGARVAGSRPKGRVRARLGDSKALVSYGDSALGEAWARALLARRGAEAPRSIDDLVFSLAVDGREHLRAPCPEAHGDQCWGTHGETGGFAAEESLVRQLGRDLDRLAKDGVEIFGARVVIACAKALNAETARGLSRFEVDLHAMERLVLHAREEAGAEVLATCGKVGGFDRYPEHFGPLGGRLHVTLDEGRAQSTYRIPDVGTISFVRDADASNLLVCLASLVGKWVRDVLMNRIVHYHRAEDPHLPDASGYHDPVTTKFIALSALTRKRRALPDECFERTSLQSKKDAEEEATSSRRPRPSKAPPKKKAPAPRPRSATP